MEDTPANYNQLSYTLNRQLIVSYIISLPLAILDRYRQLLSLGSHVILEIRVSPAHSILELPREKPQNPSDSRGMSNYFFPQLSVWKLTSVNLNQTQHLKPASPDVSTPAPKTSFAPPPAAPTPLKGFADVVEYHREHGQGGQEVEIIPTSRFIPKQKGLPKKTTQYNDYAVVLRRTWVQKDNTAICVRIELAIQSEALCKAFRKIAVSCYETTDLQSTPIKLSTPFSELFFYREDIKTLATSPTTDPSLRRDAQALYDFIQKNGLLSSIIRDDEKYSKEGRVVGDILWTIYPPNSLVMLNIKAIKECWICRNVSYYVDQRGIPHWIVLGLRIAFGSESPGLVRQTFTMPMPQMQVSKISDLPLIPFPLEDFPEKKSITASLRARSGISQKVLGKDLSSFLSQTYSGPSWNDGFDAYNTLLNPLRAAKQVC